MTQPQEKKSISKLTITLLILLVVMFSMIIGAWAMCVNSDGEIETNNWTCIQLQVVGLCEHNHKLYLADPPLNLSNSGLNFNLTTTGGR